MKNNFRQYKSPQFSTGFTLLELLVVFAIFIFAGSIAIVILMSSLRTSTKTNIINVTKENGNYALTQMTNVIRYAKTVNCPPAPTPPASVTAILTNGNQTVFDCSSNTITLNGTSILDTNSVNLVPNTCTITCTQTPTGSQIVQIIFQLKSTNTSKVSEQYTPALQFTTSVAIRNLNR